MTCDALSEVGEFEPGNQFCRAGNFLVEALNAGGCEAKQLASLLEVLMQHLDQAGERADPVRCSELAADVTRIAKDWTSRMSGRLLAAEERVGLLAPPA